MEVTGVVLDMFDVSVPLLAQLLLRKCLRTIKTHTAITAQRCQRQSSWAAATRDKSREDEEEEDIETKLL